MDEFNVGDVVLTIPPYEDNIYKQLSRLYPGIEDAYGIACNIVKKDPSRSAYALIPLSEVDTEVQRFFQEHWWDATMFRHFNIKNSFSNRILYM